MVYAFIRSEQDNHPVIMMCKVLAVSRSCYYAYCKNGDGVQKAVVNVVEQQVVNTFTAHRRRYGIRRLLPELQAQGLTIGHYKVRGIRIQFYSK